MAIAVAITKQFDNSQSLDVIGTFTASGNYATPGDAISWANTNVKSTQAPVFLTATGEAGFVYVYDYSTAKLKVYTSGANAQDPLAELSDGAYPAGVTGDVITFRAVFVKK